MRESRLPQQGIDNKEKVEKKKHNITIPLTFAYKARKPSYTFIKLLTSQVRHRQDSFSLKSLTSYSAQ